MSKKTSRQRDTLVTSESPSKQKNPEWVAEALREIQAGRNTERHFKEIYKYYEPGCRDRFRRLGFYNEAKDLAQETMLRVYKGIPGFRLESGFETWLYRIIRNVASDEYRKRDATRVIFVESPYRSAEGGDGDEPGPEEPVSPRPGPHEELLRRELDEAIEALPPKIRRVMRLYLKGFTAPATAELTGTSVHTVKAQLAQGRKKLGLEKVLPFVVFFLFQVVQTVGKTLV